ncbi:hypothetical protein M3603_15095 [Rummeliibacillus stabekisii]|uniref:hypothetical protein n=1 Tax=Rummeliibacillus stabekisii TaxID=241244 RepID=UPI00203BC43A|nr:hypothetical protein [Rummeliibacillus stabekisii]MCM3317944.1 hypothetical protein [Rummeliibacillus stabekisii]
MELLYWLERQEKQEIEELKRSVAASDIVFECTAIDDSSDILDWILEHEDEASVVIITDADSEDQNLNQLISALQNGLVIHISDKDYHSSNMNMKIKRVDNIERARKYFNSALKFIKKLESIPPSTEEQHREKEIENAQESYRVFVEEELPFIAYDSAVDNKAAEDEYDESHVMEENNVDSYPEEIELLKEESIEVEEEPEVAMFEEDKIIALSPEVDEEEIIQDDVPSASREEKEFIESEADYKSRARDIQRQLFAKQKWSDTKTIGIWSPLHRMGVTTLAMNLSFFLAENRIYTALLEGLSNQPALKDWLKRYTKIPNHWKSYAATIQSEEDPQSVEWHYRNVMCLPLDIGDESLVWDENLLEAYMTTTNIVDITIVDLPTGKMEKYTKDSLKYMDQLWIVVDDTFQDIVAWKKYIHQLQKQTGIPIYLIFNKSYEFSQVKRIGKELGFETIATLPALHEEVMRNYYDIEPLYFANEEVNELLQNEFEQIGQHLFNGKFEKKTLVEKSQQKKWKNLFNLLKKNRLFGNMKR